MTTCSDCGYETGHNLRPMCPRQKDLDGIAGRVGELRAINNWIERAVARLRAEGEPWDEIALALGVSRQAAHKRYSAPIPLSEFQAVHAAHRQSSR